MLTPKQRPHPLLFPTPVTDLKALQDILIYLPNSKLVDLRPTIESILVRGRTLGFGERHYDATFKFLIQEHFPIFAGIFNIGITADETFENL